MADETPDSVPADDPASNPTLDAVADEGSLRLPGRFARLRRATGVWTRRSMALILAVIAATFVTTFTIDLGRFPQLREVAEREGSKYLKRPLHIGGISALLTPGAFVLTDVVIDGRKPGDRPFMTAKKIYFNVPWWSLFRKRLFVEVVVDDWQIVLEQWADGHNMPKLMPERRGERRPGWFTTTTMSFAHRGTFTYEDHVTPWRVVAPNLEFALVRDAGRAQYVGTARFSDGLVQILNYRPMRTDMSTRFALDGGRIDLRHIDLVTEGAESHVSGSLDFGKWPEQSYQINARVDFATMKEIFFGAQNFRVSGESEFTGTFQLFKQVTPQGVTQLRRDLRGEFTSDLAGVNSMAFQDLHGALLWTNERFEVPHAEMRFLGGDVRLRYGMTPFGTPRPATVTFKADYGDLDASQVGPLLRLADLNLLGRVNGSIDLHWPNAHFDQMRGSGHTVLRAPEGTVRAEKTLPAVPRPARRESVPFDGAAGLPSLTMSADVHYTFDPDGITFEPSTAATEWTSIRFGGRTEYGALSDFPFEVTSHDWQESDRLLAVIMSSVTGRPTGAVEVGGRGTFAGRMTGRFSAPRIAGRFAGEQMRVWDVTWGEGTADLVIEGGYVAIANSRITRGPGTEIIADGRYSLGFRSDTAEEIRARVAMTGWPIVDLRHAFQLDDWPMDGTLGALSLDLSGRYRNMFGSGTMRIDRGEAWGEPFEKATADLELEGSGMRVNRIELQKGTGIVHGAARLGWRDGTYAFNADGDRVPVESLANFTSTKAPLSGVLRFRATGSGPFDAPSYEVEASVADLFVADEGIGQVSARLTVKNNTLTFERLTATSNRLQVSGSGSIQLNATSDADLQFRFQETSIDPYLRLLAPAYSPYTRAIVTGSLEARGPLGDLARLQARVAIDESRLTLFDYELANDGPIELRYDGQVFGLDRVRLKGLDTDLQLAGSVDVGGSRYDLSATGDVSLAILQLRYPGVAASGAAKVKARLAGPFDKQEISGEATLENGRLRLFALQHSLDQINGPIRFDGAGINVDGLRARMGGGPIAFGGTIGMSSMQFTQFNLRAGGQFMQLRYPAGFTSTVNADLALSGTLEAMRLGGNVEVIATRYEGSIEAGNGLLGLAAGGALGGDDIPTAVATEPTSSIPLTMAVDIHIPSTNIIQKGTTRIEASGDLTLSGTLDRPGLTGRVNLEGGQFFFSGNRYLVRPGSIDFPSLARIEPVFDLEVETNPRASGQTFRVVIRLAGTFRSFTQQVSSEPWLSEADAAALLLGASPNLDRELARLAPQQSQARLIETLGAQLLASPLTARVGNVVTDALPIDTVQITPVMGNDTAFQNLNPSARVTIGQRISSRAYLTYSRSIAGAQNELIMLEYDQSDRMSWVLSRNEDRSFALDFRLRFVFR